MKNQVIAISNKRPKLFCIDGKHKATNFAAIGKNCGGRLSSVAKSQQRFNYDLASNRTAFQRSTIQTVRLGGGVTTGNQVSVTVLDNGLSGGSKTISYTVVSGDTLTTIAAQLAAAITMDANMQSIGVNATASNTVISLQSVSSNITTYTPGTSGGATETATLGIVNNGTENAIIGGTKTTGDVITITVVDAGLTGGTKAINYTVLAADTLTTIATGLAAAINADTSLQAIGVTASATAQVVSIRSTSLNTTGYVKTVSGGGTETITLGLNTFIQTSAYV